jgi:hypothetical protein
MAALLFAATLSSAQDFRATLTGIVTDPSGAVTPNADVVAIERDTQQKYTAKTNSKGEYALAYMLPGSYSVSVTASGFRIKEQSGVLLQANDTLALNFQMDLGTAAQKIEITSAPPLLESATGSNNNVISSKEIEDSPLNGRQIYMLIGTTPGSEFLQTQFGSSGYSGTRGWDNSNNYTLGGGVQGYQQFQLNGSNITVQTSYQSQGQGTWQIAPNVGALQEVNVMTSTYDARYGRTGGGTMNMVVKSGTNAIHGSAYDYLENGHLNANNFQNNLTGFPRSMVHQNQFGGTAGGPIKKDKIFLFASYEGYRQAIPFTTIASVPQDSIHPTSNGGANFTGSGYTIYDPATTACSGTGSLANCPSGTYTRQAFPGDTIPANRINPLGQKVLSLYPGPNLPGIAQNFIMAAPDRYSYNQPMARLDFDTSASTRWYTLFAYQLGQEYRNTNGLPPPAERGNIAHTRGNVTASQDMTHIFSPNLLADFKLSFARFIDFASDGDLNSQPLDPTSFGLNMPVVPTRSKIDFPEITLSSYATAIGNSVTDDVWQNLVFDNEWTKMVSHHTLRFGGEIARYQFADPNTVGNPNGVFDFSGVYTQGNPLKGVTGQGSSVADLLLGFPDSGHVDWNTTIFDYNPTYSLYIQDDWKALRKLTLNIGLRYDVQIGTKERHNQLNRGMCLACVNPVTSNPQYQANLAADASALSAAHIDPASLATVSGGILFAGANGQPRDAYDTDWSNIQPRFGFAFALNSKTVLRGGYGIQYAIGLEGGTADGYSVATPYVASPNNNVTPADYFASGTPYPFGVQVAAGASQGLLTGIGNTAQLDFPQRRIPRSQITSFGIQRALPFGLLLDARYAGNFTNRLRVSVWLNGTMPYSQYQLAVQNANYFNQQVPNPYYGILPPSSTMGQKTVPAEYLMTPYSQFRLVGTYDDPLGRQWYNGLEVKLNKQLSHGLFYRLSYTYSKTMQANNYINGWPYQDPELKHQIAGSDRTHRLAITGAYELPMGKGKALSSGKAVNAIIGGWNMSWVFSKSTGTPVGLNTSYNYICDHGFAPDSGPASDNYFYAPAGKSAGACYSHVGTFQLYTGTNRTGSVRNPVIPNVDVSLQKNVRINERYRVQLRADAFNLANTPLFGGPDTNPGDVVKVSSTGVWSGVGTIGITQYNFPRVIQISLKAYF